MLIAIKTKDIEERLGFTSSQSKTIFRKAKIHIKQNGIVPIDFGTLPTIPFINYLVEHHSLDRKEIEKRFE